IVLILLLCLLVAGVVIIAIIGKMIYSAPELKASDLETPLSTQLYDQDGDLIGNVFEEENRVHVDIDDVPDDVKNAIVSIEDKRFYKHKGIDYRRISKAALANVKQGWGAEGGSTITQQVIKGSVLSSEKTLTRKVQEAWLALKLERKYSKDEILEMYLNNVYLGNGAYGVKTASKTYFNKDLDDLNISQVALLAGLPNAPSADEPFNEPERAEKRRNKVLNAMVSNDIISEEEAEEAKGQAIEDIVEKTDTSSGDTAYKGFIDTVYDQIVQRDEIVTEEEFYQGGLKIYTTANTEAQELVNELMHSEDFPYPDDNYETGIALVDTETGAVQAIGGGRNFQAIHDTNYGASSSNSPGSTIKPILDYGPAIEHLNWSTEKILSDEEYSYDDGTPVREWDGEYWGDISMRRALEWSRNIPAVKAFQEVGKEKTKEFANNLDIEVDTTYDSAALGSFEEGSTPLQMAEAYAAFGNGGTFNKPSLVEKIEYQDGSEWEAEKPESREAMQDYTAYMMTDMLKTVIKTGTGSQANVPELPIAGKTGSTNIPDELKQEHGINDGLLDSWFVGYTPQYSLAIWTGYPSFKDEDGDVQYIQEDGSQHIAKQLFQQIMSQVSDPSMEDFKKPDSVIEIGGELYVKGSQPAQEEPSEEPDTDTNQEEENTNQEEDNNQEEQEEQEQEEQEKKEQEEKEQKEKEEEEKENEEEEKKEKEEKEKEEKEKEEKEKKEQEEKEKQEKEEKEQENNNNNNNDNSNDNNNENNNNNNQNNNENNNNNESNDNNDNDG
ncbi:MAG TPA: PBP1A family penicillin-binding protein, partial [Pseudogracilibacillus sp.]|nr:PBP1A family penicillin-binding protein [Pseudogracilibacillus sp.]